MAPRTLRAVPAATSRTSPAFERYQQARAALEGERAREAKALSVFRGYQDKEQAALAEQDAASEALGASVAAELQGEAGARVAAEKRYREASTAADAAEEIVRKAETTMQQIREGVMVAERELARALAAFLPEVEAVLAAEYAEALERTYALAARRIAIHRALGGDLTGEPARLGESGVAAIARRHGMQENLYPSAVPPFAGDIIAEVTRILGCSVPEAPEAA